MPETVIAFSVHLQAGSHLPSPRLPVDRNTLDGVLFFDIALSLFPLHKGSNLIRPSETN